MTSITTPSYKDLFDIAFHSEKVKSKRLGKTKSITIEEALPLVLLQTRQPSDCLTTDVEYLSQIISERKTLLQKQIASKDERRKKNLQRHQLKKQENAIPNNAWCLWFDGSAKPNPGKCSIGVVLQSPNGQQQTISRRIDDGDNSDAEYQALIAGLTIAVENARSQKIERLYVIGDSQVVLNDVQNLNANLSLILKEYRLQAHVLIHQLTSVVFMWKPRHQNTKADALALSAQQS